MPSCRKSRWPFLAAIAIAMALCQKHGDASNVEQPAGGGRHALLVGVGHYPHLVGMDLEGPENDVRLMEKLLREMFNFPPGNIATLSDQSGGADPEKLPTRANIQREFLRLAQVAKPGDQVVIFMAGHGSQQPEEEDPVHPEPDGLDEIFLPRDVRQWEGAGHVGHVPQAIVDVEIGRWLQAIRDQGASIWIIFDACHSGHMIRGVSERVRQVPSGPRGLNIPAEAIQRARQRAAARLDNRPERTRGGFEQPAPLQLSQEPGMVALYACQPAEVTVELGLPHDSDEAVPLGLLTYTLSQVLLQASRPLTYNELIRQIHDQYIALGRRSPTPLIEGDDRDREVLGTSIWPERSRMVIHEQDAKLKVNAGALHGLTVDSILAVYAADTDNLVGHVRITRTAAHEAEVAPSSYENMPAPDRGALLGGWCEPVHLDYGDLRVSVAVDPENSQGDPLPKQDRQRLIGMLENVGKQPNSLIALATRLAEARWLVRLDRGNLHLVPAAEWSRQHEEREAGQRDEQIDEQVNSRLLGSLPADAEPSEIGEQLQDKLTRIARAENLVRLASVSPARVIRRPGGLGVDLDVQVVRHRDENDELGEAVVWPDRGGVAFHDGDLITLRIRNPGRISVDLTLLYIDSGYGIEPLFPDHGELNRLEPGDSIAIPLEVTAETSGLEHLLMIAVRGEGLPVDFAALAQPTIEQARQGEVTRGIPAARGLESPLGRLLQNAMYGQGASRSMRRRESQDSLVRRLSWQIVPAARN